MNVGLIYSGHCFLEHSKSLLLSKLQIHVYYLAFSDFNPSPTEEFWVTQRYPIYGPQLPQKIVPVIIVKILKPDCVGRGLECEAFWLSWSQALLVHPFCDCASSVFWLKSNNWLLDQINMITIYCILYLLLNWCYW